MEEEAERTTEEDKAPKRSGSLVGSFAFRRSTKSKTTITPSASPTSSKPPSPHSSMDLGAKIPMVEIKVQEGNNLYGSNLFVACKMASKGVTASEVDQIKAFKTKIARTKSKDVCLFDDRIVVHVTDVTTESLCVQVWSWYDGTS